MLFLGHFHRSKNAEIAIAIVSQNDSIGGGGRAAAPIARQNHKEVLGAQRKANKSQSS